MSVKPLISVSSLSFSYDGEKVLDNISFDIEQGDFVALIGPNGSGKTTLVKILLGLLSHKHGTINLSLPRSSIGYVPQNYSIERNFPGTVKEILYSESSEVLKEANVQDLLEKKFVELSGGQQQRVLIALALQQNPGLLILDEPTAGIDVHAQKSFYGLLKKLNMQGITIIFVTHEVGVIPSLVKKVLCINHSVCCIGKPKELPELLKQMYGGEFVPHHHIDHHGEHHD